MNKFFTMDIFFLKTIILKINFSLDTKYLLEI